MPETNPLGQTEMEWNRESVVSRSKQTLVKQKTSRSSAKNGACTEPIDKGNHKQSQKRARRVRSRKDVSNQMSPEATDSSDAKLTILEFKEESCEADWQSPDTGHDSAKPGEAPLSTEDVEDNSECSFHDTASKKTHISNATATSVGVKKESTAEEWQSESVDLNEHYGKQLADLFLGNF